ncbi:hypothetical protein SUGI_0212850 [Cryptomeria japonica]|nr:hypothetical protein SUGI_0212850 [Cryptomeria japonica]
MSALHACSRLGNLEQGYAQNGYGTEALEMFDQMKMTEVEPNSSTMDMTLSLRGTLRKFRTKGSSGGELYRLSNMVEK